VVANGCSGCAFDGGCVASTDCEAGLACVGSACVCGEAEQVGTATVSWTDSLPGGLILSYACTNCGDGAVEKVAICDAGCDTYFPSYTLVSLTVPDSGVTAAAGSSLVSLPGGGLALAWIDATTSTTAYPIHYTECAGDCLDGGAWVDTIIDTTDASKNPPTLAVSDGGVRGIAFCGLNAGGNKRGLWYAECAGACTSAASWSAGSMNAGNSVNLRPGLALLDLADGGLLRMAADGRSYLECSSGCAGNTVGVWSLTTMTTTNADVELRLGPDQLPRLAGINNTGVLKQVSCVQAPCSSSTNWTPLSQVATNALYTASAKLDFQIDPATGYGTIAFATNSNVMTLALQSSFGTTNVAASWLSAAVTTCGGSDLKGNLPALAETASGGFRIYESVNTLPLPDGGSLTSGHAQYTVRP
jgi:hypothetical protein